jgi:hypothetical protein
MDMDAQQWLDLFGLLLMVCVANKWIVKILNHGFVIQANYHLLIAWIGMDAKNQTKHMIPKQHNVVMLFVCFLNLIIKYLLHNPTLV